MKLNPKRASPVLSVHTLALVSYAGISSLYRAYLWKNITKLAEFALQYRLQQGPSTRRRSSFMRPGKFLIRDRFLMMSILMK